MKNLSLLNPKDSMEISGKAVKGFTLPLFLTGDGTVTIGATTIFDPSKLTLKLTLMRGGGQMVIFNETLLNLLTLLAWRKPIYENIIDRTKKNQITTVGGKVTEAFIPFVFELGGVIDLRQGGQLLLEWNLDPAFFVQPELVKALCSFSVDIWETEEFEYYTPVINSRLVEVNQPNPRWDIGSDISRLVVTCYDKPAGPQPYDQVLQDVTINGDNFKMSDRWIELLAKGANDFVDQTLPAYRYRTFFLYDDDNYDLDNTTIEMTYRAADVNAGQNWLLIQRRVTSDWHVTMAALNQARRNEIQARKGQFNKSVADKVS